MKYLYQNNHWSINKDYNLDKLLYLMIDRPNKINKIFNDFIWENNKKQLHRDYNLPSYIETHNQYFCKIFWYQNNEYYRECV